MQGGFKLKRLVLQKPFLLENAVHVNTFKIETKTFQIQIYVDDIFYRQHFGTIRCAWFCSLTYQKPQNEAFGRFELYSVKDRGSE